LAGFLAAAITEEEMQEFRRHARSGRPLGREQFIQAVERTLGRTFRRGKPGPRGGGGEETSMGSPE
jgi:putative transposase